MMHRSDGPDDAARSRGKDSKPKSQNDTKGAPARRHRKGWIIVVLLILAVLGTARALLPWGVRKYVNRTLDRNLLYAGKIGPVEVHLWRGAYSIRNVEISKVTGNVPVPFFSAKRVDFSVQWHALIHGKIVGQVTMDQPVVNFVDAPTEGQSQSGGGGPWLQMIRDLFPFQINKAEIKDGSIHFRAYQTPKPVDVYLSEVQITVDNLGNIRNETTPLVAKVDASALAMGQAKLDLKMTLDPFSYHPTFHLILRLLGLDVVKLNDLALAYGKFDFKRGWLDLVIEATCQEGQLSGYVKPLFRDLKFFSLKEDVKEDSILQLFWQALIGAVTTVFKNQPRNQLGTLVPFSGSVTGQTSTDILATIGNLLRNAFVRAYLPRLQSANETNSGFLQFEAPEITAPVSPTEAP